MLRFYAKSNNECFTLQCWLLALWQIIKVNTIFSFDSNQRILHDSLDNTCSACRWMNSSDLAIFICSLCYSVNLLVKLSAVYAQ